MKDTTTVFDLTTEAKEKLLKFLITQRDSYKYYKKHNEDALFITEINYLVKIIINDLEATK